MNHQIKRDINVQTSWRERSQPMDFEKLRPGREFRGESNDGIKTFDVAHLKYASILPGRIDQRSGLLEIRSDGLLHQNVHSLLQKLDTNAGVVGSWNGEAHRVDFAEDIAVIGKRGGVVKRCDVFG